MHLTRSVSYQDEAELTSFGPVTLVEVTYRGPLEARTAPLPRHPGPAVAGAQTFLVRSREVTDLPEDALTHLESLERISVLNEKGQRWLVSEPPRDRQEGVLSPEELRPALEAGVHPSLLVRSPRMDPFLYPLESDLPLSCVYHWDYTGGIRDDEYDMERSRRALESSPWVLSMERLPVPDYQQDDGRSTEYWDTTFLLPQWAHDAMVEHFRSATEGGHWILQVPDALLRPPEPRWDLLHLGQARLTPEEYEARERLWELG